MAVTSLRSEPPAARPDEFERLYRAWRYAKAAWELADYDPERPKGLPEDERDAHCEAEHGALMAYLLYPISNAEQLARKTAVIRDEGAWDFGQAKEIFEQLARDARVLAYPQTARQTLA